MSPNTLYHCSKPCPLPPGGHLLSHARETGLPLLGESVSREGSSLSQRARSGRGKGPDTVPRGGPGTVRIPRCPRREPLLPHLGQGRRDFLLLLEGGRVDAVEDGREGAAREAGGGQREAHAHWPLCNGDKSRGKGGKRPCGRARQSLSIGAPGPSRGGNQPRRGVLV